MQRWLAHYVSYNGVYCRNAIVIYDEVLRKVVSVTPFDRESHSTRFYNGTINVVKRGESQEEYLVFIPLNE
ncbi:MAG TPA: hypothetical protein DCR38_08820 [Butyricimonas virosa]|nr:hypothetical protein [Butyricimonas virosa]